VNFVHTFPLLFADVGSELRRLAAAAASITRPREGRQEGITPDGRCKVNVVNCATANRYARTQHSVHAFEENRCSEFYCLCTTLPRAYK
jgi:hypothetical protein